MSWQAVDAVMDHSRTRNGVREVLVAIATYADTSGRGSRPSVDTLARRTNKCARQITRILQTLETDFPNEIRVEKGNGRGNPSTYTILLPLDCPERVTSKPLKGDIYGDSAPLKGDISAVKGDIPDEERVTFGEIKGDIYGGAYIGETRVGEPSENREEEPERPPNPRTGGTAVVYSDEFALEWSRYPQVGRVRSSKSEAFGEYQRLGEKDRAAFSAALSTALLFPDFCEKFAPALERWLKKRKWEAYAEAVKPPPRASPVGTVTQSVTDTLGYARMREEQRRREKASAEQIPTT